MRLMSWLVAAAMATSLIAQDDCKKCRKCGNNTYGTSVQFEEGPTEAAEKAKKEEKLVFILHVSGYFEDPKFT